VLSNGPPQQEHSDRHPVTVEFMVFVISALRPLFTRTSRAMVLLAQPAVSVARADRHGAAGVGGVALAQQ
jgi:hypothetical protein